MVRIAYCPSCGYLGRARRAQQVLLERLGVEAALEGDAERAFEIWVGDVRVARKTLDGFPTEEGLVSAVAMALGH